MTETKRISDFPVCKKHNTIMTFGRFSNKREFRTAQRKGRNGFTYYCTRCCNEIMAEIEKQKHDFALIDKMVDQMRQQ